MTPRIELLPSVLVMSLSATVAFCAAAVCPDIASGITFARDRRSRRTRSTTAGRHAGQRRWWWQRSRLEPEAIPDRPRPRRTQVEIAPRLEALWGTTDARNTGTEFRCPARVPAYVAPLGSLQGRSNWTGKGI